MTRLMAGRLGEEVTMIRAPLTLGALLTLSLGVLSPAAAAPGEQGKGLIPVRVTTFTPTPALVVADALGYFAAEGLAVSWELIASSTAQMQGLVAGEADITITAFDNLLASATREGAPSVTFA